MLDDTCEAWPFKRGRFSEEGDEASISLSSSASSRCLRMGTKPGMFAVATAMCDRVVGFRTYRCCLMLCFAEGDAFASERRRAGKWKARCFSRSYLRPSYNTKSYACPSDCENLINYWIHLIKSCESPTFFTPCLSYPKRLVVVSNASVNPS